MSNAIDVAAPTIVDRLGDVVGPDKVKNVAALLAEYAKLEAAQHKPDLYRLEYLFDLMRKKGVTELSTDGLRIVLGPIGTSSFDAMRDFAIEAADR